MYISDLNFQNVSRDSIFEFHCNDWFVTFKSVFVLHILFLLFLYSRIDQLFKPYDLEGCVTKRETVSLFCKYQALSCDDLINK